MAAGASAVGRLVGVAIIPSAPLLVPGVSARLPVGVATVADAVDAAVESLPQCDAALLVASGEPGLWESTGATLGGVGRPDLRRELVPCEPLTGAAAAATGLPRHADGPVPVGLTVLALLLGRRVAVTSLAVVACQPFAALTLLGGELARAIVGSGLRVCLLAAGDCSAGLSDRAPLALVDGAREWDERLVATVDSGRLDGLGRLGPGEAQRVGAVGWAPMAVVHGVCEAAMTGVVVRHYSAPRGVGYLVAVGG